MKSIASFGAGEILAYLLPGFVAFYALRHVFHRVDVIWAASFTRDGGLGAELAVLVLSFSVGVVVSACRNIVLDRFHLRTGVSRATYDYAKLKDEPTRSAFLAVLPYTYRLAQFYGNMFVAVLLLLLVLLVTNGIAWLELVALVIALLVLFPAHRIELRFTDTVWREILK